MSSPVAEMNERDEQSVNEPQPVLRAGAHDPLPRPGRKPRLVPLMPQRAELRDKFSDHDG
ncbi:hypothetical protein ACF07Y_36665 [Streptomyces sp. NPDC016566]|uniref:hypothetical protein n=1 Tax=Streptomyces sp. NPDC016566 TaxID=3364967 RepID=UPI0036FE8725